MNVDVCIPKIHEGEPNIVNPRNDRMATRRLKYFTRAMLFEVVAMGETWNYNRQLEATDVANLPEVRFPATFMMDHYHRGGEPCEPHIRCGLTLDAASGHLLVDVPTEFYRRLPTGDFKVVVRA